MPPPLWQPVAPRIWVRRNPHFGMNSGLVVGERRALLIDTGAGPQEAAALHAAVGELTALPLLVVNTHAHFDHFFGNAYFALHGAADIWAHRRCAERIADDGGAQRALAAGVEPAMAAAQVPEAAVVAPNRVVEDEPVELDLGGIAATLFHLGRGHTDNDMLVGAGDVLFTGDLVEEGADPAFEDSFPHDWMGALAAIAALSGRYVTFVPGHGRPVPVDFVSTQLATMRTALRVASAALGESAADATKAVPILPYGPEQARELIGRLRAGY